MRAPVMDYRSFSWSKRKEPSFQHLLWLLYWPAFWLMFLFVERFFHPTAFHAMHCIVDDWVPFCEWFLLPYFFWFIYVFGMVLYTLFYDVETFVKLMKFVAFTYTVSVLIYLLYPNCQELRPVTFARENLLTQFLPYFYAFDTNTNVFPSIHVIGSLAVWMAAWYSKDFSTPKWRFWFGVVAILICLSTMFLKQHSFLDVLGGVALSGIGYWLCFREKPRKRRKKR